MPASVPPKRPINWARLTAGDAERVIRERANDSSKVIVIEGAHAQLRGEERDILAPDMWNILRRGFVLRDPILNARGDWEAVIQRRIKGTRDAGVATIILTRDEKLIVKTIMWMDYLK
jgi:hypothetical protein